MPLKVLNEDWTDYDNRKIRDRLDTKIFSCSEEWEVYYLIFKIRSVYPDFSERKIKTAISSCCKSMEEGHPRESFVKCVMFQLHRL